MDSVTSRNLFEDHTVELPTPDALVTKADETDGMSTISTVTSVRSRSSVHTYSRLLSSNLWADVDQVMIIFCVFILVIAATINNC